MKRAYESPKAVLVDFSFDTNVVAQSITCSGSKYVYREPSGCSIYKYTDFQSHTRELHPCDWVSDNEEFIT